MAVRGTIAEQIWSWLTDLEIVAFTGHNETCVLVYCYNWATSPSRAMTDREHKACRRLARFCKSRLNIRMGWNESDDGRLFV